MSIFNIRTREGCIVVSIRVTFHHSMVSYKIIGIGGLVSFFYLRQAVRDEKVTQRLELS